MIVWPVACGHKETHVLILRAGVCVEWYAFLTLERVSKPVYSCLKTEESVRLSQSEEEGGEKQDV